MSNLKGINSIFSVTNKVFNKHYFLILFLIFIRTSYILITKNNTGDLGFYDEIANGILNGCGIGLFINNEVCSPIVGHFFPGFFYLIAITYKTGIGLKGLVILISLFQLFSFYYLYLIINKYTNRFYLGKKIFIFLALSPLTLGWSRLILMEPLLTSFSTLFLAKFIQIFHEGFKRGNFIFLLILQILGIYIKPTAILFSIPFILLGLVKLNLFKFYKKLLVWILIIIIAIAPWGFRNINKGSKEPFSSVLNSNFFPQNSNGYINWLSSWVITEHEQAANAFPIFSKIYFDVKIKKGRFNPFITDKEIKEVEKRMNNKTNFSPEDDKFFKKLNKLRRKKLGISGSLSLYFAKITSLLFNPLNSWGWPLEMNSEIKSFSKEYFNTSNIKKIILVPTLAFKFILKICLFVYRIGLFYIFSISLIKKFAFKKLFSFKSYSLEDVVKYSAFSFLLATLYLVAIQYPSLEHRFISVVIPWIEYSAVLYFYK